MVIDAVVVVVSGQVVVEIKTATVVLLRQIVVIVEVEIEVIVGLHVAELAAQTCFGGDESLYNVDSSTFLVTPRASILMPLFWA